MIRVKSMFWLMLAPVVTAAACWLIWVSLVS